MDRPFTVIFEEGEFYKVLKMARELGYKFEGRTTSKVPTSLVFYPGSKVLVKGFGQKYSTKDGKSYNFYPFREVGVSEFEEMYGEAVKTQSNG